MALVGTAHLAYVASHSFREIAARFVDPDEYGVIYTVTYSSHTPNVTKPSRDDLDAAHWAMFLALIAKDYPELKAISEQRGFGACWEVHRLDIESGDDCLSDARSLSGS